MLHVVPPDASAQERADAEDVLQFAEHVLGPDVAAEAVIREGSNIRDGIVQAAKTTTSRRSEPQSGDLD
ncbi:hypothetical protein [Halocatena pleomorpha]|uniref:Uncharacterized protein n=1 Tax=Halocatena pleomorpha TaxID=1785090 RepID=A0A3P3RL29_9EURY|nr:hypothetical protein [Halocatena pleomorpha]RRJ34237.1 hypothetical protein EIK79_00215 [Halocatena pleomorpha]